MSKLSKWFDKIYPIAWIISRFTKTEKDDEAVDKAKDVREVLRSK